MAHELRHCKQYTDMLRTEGITVEKYVESAVKSMMDGAKNNALNFQYQAAYNKAKEQGRLQEFLENVKNNGQKIYQNRSEKITKMSLLCQRLRRIRLKV